MQSYRGKGGWAGQTIA